MEYKSMCGTYRKSVVTNTQAVEEPEANPFGASSDQAPNDSSSDAAKTTLDDFEQLK